MNILDLKRKLLPMSGYQMGGGGSGGGGSTTSTSYQTNIPEYARPYVENMLMATQKQIFKPGTSQPQYEDVPVYEDRQVFRGRGGATTERVQVGTEKRLIPGSDVPSGDPDSFQPYRAYGGTYDEKGNQISYDPSKGIAGFQQAQLDAQKAITGMKTPGQFGAASDFAAQAGMGGMSSAQDAMRYGEQGQQSGLMGQALGIQGGQLGITGGQRYGDIGVGYGAQGAGYGAQGAGLAGTALGYGQESSDIGRMGLRAEQYGRQVSGQAEDYARQAAGAGAQYARMAIDPRVTQALMNPYTQNVLDVQNRELERQASIASTQRGAQAARSGAFGGSRQAIENAEANRNLAGMKTANTAQALNQAYQQAQQAQQFGANLNLQGLQGAQQGLGTALQGGQLGLSGIGTALQGQQGALSGVGAANQAYQTGIQGAQAGMQGAQVGLAGVDRQLAGVDRQLAGTAQGMQGAQVGLQGVSGAQAGYGLANQAGSNLANIGAQQQANELALYGAQNAVGAQQQALEQQIKNQAIQDYANAQQYPLMQLGTMSNMLRGLPMQAQSTQQYQAQPNLLTQGIGALGAGASLYNAFNPPAKTGASGGLPSEFKYSKGGGIMSYDVGGEVESQLENMDEEGLAEQAKESSSPTIRKMAQRLLRERQMSKQPQGTGPMGVQYQAAQAPMPSLAGGGIIAFAKPTENNNQSLVTDEKPELTAGQQLQQRVMQAKPTGDVMTQPQGIVQAAPPPPAPTFNQTVQGDVNLTPAMKAAQREAADTAAVPVEDIIARNQAARKAAGIEAPGIEQRARLMAERANAEDEAERTRNLRLAEFFASWGSTPGDTLTAGMTAFKNKVPDMISDQKEAKRIRMEIDKSLASLDEATRLEKVGNFDAATAEKQKAAEIAKAVNFEVIKLGETEAAAVRGDTRKEKSDIREGQRQEARDMRSGTLQKEIAQMKIDAEIASNKILAGFRAADKQEASKDRLITLYRGAQSDIAAVESRISNIMKSEEYGRDLENSRMKIDSDSSPNTILLRDNAKEALRRHDESFKTAREAVDNTIRFMEDRLNAKGIELPTKKPKGSDTPPPLPPGAKLD